MARFRNAAPVLLINVNLFLTLIAGANLVTTARLKWDPSTYIVVRGLFPTEYRVGAVVLCVSGFALISLGQLTIFALFAKPSLRRVLFLTYTLLLGALICVEIIWGIWMLARVINWLQSPIGIEIIGLLRLGKKLEHIPKIMLLWLSKFMPIAGDIYKLIEEIEEDIPKNVYFGIGVVVLTVILEVIALSLAIYCARASRKCASQRKPYNLVAATANKLPPVSKSRLNTDGPHLKSSEFQSRQKFFENLAA